MNDKEFLEEKAILEDKIAHLCNEFVQCRNIHIEHIYVNYGACNKGYFPHWVINIDVHTTSTLVLPCGNLSNDECDSFYHNLFGSKIKEDSEVKEE